MNNLRRTLCVCGAIAGVTAIVAFASPSFAEDWPQWRGPQRTGLSKEKGLLKEWPKSGPKLLWQVKEIGYGFGPPAVAGERIFVISNTGNDNEFVQALSVKEGGKLWETRIGKVGRPDQQPSYPGARSTPTVEGNRLYVLGSDGDLVCLETATGKVVWQKNVREEFGGQSGVWAYSESPLVDGDLVVCTPGGSEATLLAVNKKTGAVVWKSAVPGADNACYASIIVTDIGGIKQYVQYLHKGVVGVDARTGKFLWRYDKTAETRMGGNVPTPVAYENYVYSASGLTGGGLARIKETGGAFEVEPIYFAKKLPNAIGGSVRVGDYLYGASGQALTCVEFKTGEVKWSERGVGAGSVCYADGNLYVHGENGDMALVEATPQAYREKGRFTPPNGPERARTQAWAPVAIANGRLYIRDLGTLWCYDVKGK